VRTLLAGLADQSRREAQAPGPKRRPRRRERNRGRHSSR
jgi:hypothetical protein